MDSIYVPHAVELDGSALVFDRQSDRAVRVPEHLLENFLRLNSDESILTFARKYGPLRLDATNVSELLQRLAKHGLEFLFYIEDREETEMWRRTRRQFSDLLVLAASLREDDRPRREVLLELSQHLGVVDIEADAKNADWPGLPASVQRAGAELVLIYHLRTLATVCGLKPAISIVNFGARYAQFDLVFQDAVRGILGSISLFGALLVQMMAAVTSTGFATCSACGKAYVPRRRPRTGERHYCSECGRAAAVRDAKINYRNNRRAKGSKR
jgi:hypothetical protein